MTGLFWDAATAVLGTLYAASLPFSGWLVWEAHRIRRAEARRRRSPPSFA